MLSSWFAGSPFVRLCLLFADETPRLVCFSPVLWRPVRCYSAVFSGCFLPLGFQRVREKSPVLSASSPPNRLRVLSGEGRESRPLRLSVLSLFCRHSTLSRAHLTVKSRKCRPLQAVPSGLFFTCFTGFFLGLRSSFNGKPPVAVPPFSGV